MPHRREGSGFLRASPSPSRVRIPQPTEQATVPKFGQSLESSEWAFLLRAPTTRSHRALLLLTRAQYEAYRGMGAGSEGTGGRRRVARGHIDRQPRRGVRAAQAGSLSGHVSRNITESAAIAQHATPRKMAPPVWSNIKQRSWRIHSYVVFTATSCSQLRRGVNTTTVLVTTTSCSS